MLILGPTGCRRSAPVGERRAPDGRRFIRLPDWCNTPDAMALLGDGSFVLSVPNYNDPTTPAEIVRITPDNRIERFFTPPPHPQTGHAGPMGICVAPSGDLYYADNQFGEDSHGRSRVMRIKMRNGRPVTAHGVVSGLNVANAVVVRDGYLYVSDTVLVPGSKPLLSGVFRIPLGQEGLTLQTPLKEDPHLLATIETYHESIGYGADGLCFDPQGRLYVGNFADGTIHRITLDPDGNVVENVVWLDDPKVESADGLFYDPDSQAIYVADMIRNAVHAVTLDGTVRTLAVNGDTDGADGGLDQPCEAIVRGREVVVSNMDWPFEGVTNTTWDEPYTLSIIPLD